ncbi:GAF domain-containing protein [Alteromonas sp. IB21]|uniref:HWE histidine kinase domain-containing protein n=1 Tax=Alteromonas sp. IB21 TaxID=2779369 RepID=UPI0018E7D101|nr:HWE histidine kinase domain-containing protein [Alteromonas sp. IB21]MBJ2128571.1 GAF domain-containing protein [Alteromonas sp. IB21]
MSSDTKELSSLITQCDKEPIHLLGKIQNHGFMVILDRSGTIEYLSKNASPFLKKSTSELIGTSLWSILDRSLVHSIKGAQSQAIILGKAAYLYSVSVPFSDNTFDLCVHQSDGYLVLEFENSESSRKFESVIEALMIQMTMFSELDELYSGLAQSVRTATGFDRVMVYQFLADGAGEVVAESTSSDMPPFLGLRYPASDIPRQARQLYKKNLIRTISDVHGVTHEILGRDENKARHIDLSLSRLRAVSEVHIQYLKNMGVGASMSISLIVEGELWGLIACHHNSPKVVPSRLVSQLELFAEMFSLELSRRLVTERIRVSEQANSTFARVLSNFSHGGPITNAIVEQLALLKTLIDIDGVGCIFSGEYTRAGSALDEESILRLTAILRRLPEEEIHQFDSLADCGGDFSGGKVAGVLALKISSQPMDYIFLFRNSVVEQVTWAGNPEKRVEQKGQEKILTPRASFDKWIEYNEFKSIPWTTLDIERAKSIRLGVMELTIRHLHEKEALQREAKKRLELLIGELNHRVRNILNLVSAIIGQTSQHKKNINEFVSSLSSRISALALGHDQLTHASYNSIYFRQLLNNELKAYMVNESSFHIEGPEIKLKPYAVTPIVLVFHEMITNAAKYGALSATSNDGRVSITWELDNRGCKIFWEELGGPPLHSLGEDSFGMTVIKSVIPHELKGRAEIKPTTTGLTAEFLIPSKYIEFEEAYLIDEQDEGNNRTIKANKIESPKPLSSAFIVEDNLLISLDLKKHLKKMGLEQIEIFGDIASVRAALAKSRPSMMFLDVHLGHENTFQLGVEIAKLSIPFIFITGYGAAIELPDELKDVTVLTKPVDTGLLRQSIEALGFKV